MASGRCGNEVVPSQIAVDDNSTVIVVTCRHALLSNCAFCVLSAWTLCARMTLMRAISQILTDGHIGRPERRDSKHELVLFKYYQKAIGAWGPQGHGEDGHVDTVLLLRSASVVQCGMCLVRASTCSRATCLTLNVMSFWLLVHFPALVSLRRVDNSFALCYGCTDAQSTGCGGWRA